MSILETIQSTVKDVVGRCYPMVAPEKPTVPYAIYFQVTNVPEVVMKNEVPIENSRIQVDVYCKTYAEAQTKADAIRTAMMGIGAVPVSAGDLYESEVKLYRVTQDFSIWF